MFNFSLVILFLTGIPLAYFVNKKYFKLILKDIRPFRLAHFELMFCLGIVWGLKLPGFALTADNLFSFIFIPISIIFAWIYSVMTNNLTDYEIAKISNKERPLIKENINPQLYAKLSWLFLALALFYAGFAGFNAFFITLLFIGNYFLYSMPPFRLKRIPFFSKALIALNSLALLILGFISVTGTSIEDFPKILALLFLVGFTAVINFIDLKDYEGDKKEGIKTLPVLLGLKRAKLVVSLFFILAYFSICLIAKDIFTLISFLALGCLQFYLINRKNYNEKYVFSVYLLSLIILIVSYYLAPGFVPVK